MKKYDSPYAVVAALCLILATLGIAFAQNWGGPTNATSSSELATSVSDEIGTGNVVFSTNTTLTTPKLVNPRVDGTVTATPHFGSGLTALSSTFSLSAAGNIDAAGTLDLGGYSIGNGPVYASMRIDGTVAVTEALTDDTYVEIIDAAIVAGSCVATHTTCDATNDNIDIATAGTYDVSFEMSFSCDGVPSNEILMCSVFKEGTVLNGVSFHRTMTSTAYGVAGARSILAVAANDTLDVRCMIDDATPPNLVIEHLTLNAVRLGD